MVEYKKYSYFTPCEDLVKKHVNYVSIGVRLGHIENSRFEPNQNLFTAFGNCFNIKLEYNFSHDNVRKYLRGETLDVDLPDGFGALMINGCPLGGFKISKSKFKNYYPKGLRNF